MRVDLNEIWPHDKGAAMLFPSLYLSFSRYLTPTMSNRYKSEEAIRVQLSESAEIRKREESLEMVEATLVPRLILALQHTSISDK